MKISTPGSPLVGRDAELAVVERWVAGLDGGPSALVVSGEPGIGKTTVWATATAAARDRGIPVLLTRPVEAELQLGYGGLGDLLADVIEPVLVDLPEAQGRALSAALEFGGSAGGADPLLVGRAVASALRALGRDGPVVLAIDDVQWLDQASTRALAYATRRLGDAAVGFVVSLRAGQNEPLALSDALADSAFEVRLGGLTLGALGHVLRQRVDPELSRRRLVEIHARSAGNPFFATELATGTDDALPSTLRDLVTARLSRVPPRADRAIESVAVLGPSPLTVIDDLGGLDEAVTAGILTEQDGLVRFTHPLLAAGAYQRIPPGRRLELHRRAALASTTIEDRARHLALASTEPDGSVAAVLDSAAGSARSRGAPEAAAEFAAQARRLTPPAEATQRARRALDQADDLFLAADESAARKIVDEVLAQAPTGVVLARALAQRAIFDLDPVAAVGRLELAVAEPYDDDGLRGRILAQLAWQRGMWLGDVEPAIHEARAAVAAAERSGDEASLMAALSGAGLLTAIEGLPETTEHFERALSIMDRVPAAAGDHSPAIAFANERWWRGEFEAAAVLMAREQALANERGDEGQAMRLDYFGAELALRRGQWDDADRLLEAALGTARDYWRIVVLIRRGILRARRGDVAALTDAAEISASPVARADPIIAATAAFVVGSIDLAQGRANEAGPRMASLPETSDGNPARRAEYAVYVPETVAALLEGGWPDQAERLTAQLARREAQLAPWGTAASALCRGLLDLSAGRTASALERIERARAGFEAIGAPWELAQTRLAEGRALRRSGRRRAAAEAAERAAQLFAGLGAEPAHRRALDELQRARPRPRSDDSLTTAETRVARLVATGNTNREVAAQLFTTVATVEAHLTRTYAKAGVRSRTELARAISDGTLRLEPEASDDAGPPGRGGGPAILR